MTIEIKGKQIELKHSLRAYMVYENIMGDTFSGAGLTQTITLYWCIIMTSADELDLTLDEFINMLDENPELLNELSEWFINVNKQQSKMRKKTDVKKKKEQK